MKHAICSAMIVATLTCGAVVGATELPMCDALIWEECLDSTMNVTVSGGTQMMNATVGDMFDVITTIDVRDDQIEGWSYGVYSDPAFITVHSAHDNASHPLIQQASFNFMQPAISSNNGFIQAVVLAFTTATYLPLGDKDLVMATSVQEIITAPPMIGSEVHWASGLVGSGQPVSFAFAVDATTRYPRKVRHLMVYP